MRRPVHKLTWIQSKTLSRRNSFKTNSFTARITSVFCRSSKPALPSLDIPFNANFVQQPGTPQLQPLEFGAGFGDDLSIDQAAKFATDTVSSTVAVSTPDLIFSSLRSSLPFSASSALPFLSILQIVMRNLPRLLAWWLPLPPSLLLVAKHQVTCLNHPLWLPTRHQPNPALLSRLVTLKRPSPGPLQQNWSQDRPFYPQHVDRALSKCLFDAGHNLPYP